MKAVLSAIFWLFLVLSCIPLFVGALIIFLVTLPFDWNRKILHLYSCGWAQLYFWVNPFWKLTVEGREHLPWRGPAVIVANHESLGDILVLFGLYRPYKWVSKSSVFKVPLIGWNMVLNGYVPLVRGNKESIVKMLSDCERWLDRGVPVLIFPEGTRSSDGTVKPFKDGAFHLAVKKGVPVIPIALTGTGRGLPKTGWVIRENANCRVRVMPAVSPTTFNGNVDGLREHVRGLIIAERQKMDAELLRPR